MTGHGDEKHEHWAYGYALQAFDHLRLISYITPTYSGHNRRGQSLYCLSGIFSLELKVEVELWNLYFCHVPS